MEHYVTLFDSRFIPQGIALYFSMQKYVKDFILWILCVDDEAHEVLARLQFDNVRLLRLGELETEDLLRIKPTRSKAEYCWTLTPFAPKFVFDADFSVERVTYLDADLCFYKHPSDIFIEYEASGKSVLITEHAYAPEYDQSATSGRYCVQFMTFSRRGEAVRKWWEDRCLEWCYARFEDGKFGDQKYLDEWPERFGSEVHVLRNLGAALAPWNAIRFPYSDAVFYHFHGLRILSRRRVAIGGYRLPRPLVKNIYAPYLKSLKDGVEIAEKAGWRLRPQSSIGIYWVLRNIMRDVYAGIAGLPFGVMRWY